MTLQVPQSPKANQDLKIFDQGSRDTLNLSQDTPKKTNLKLEENPQSTYSRSGNYSRYSSIGQGTDLKISAKPLSVMSKRDISTKNQSRAQSRNRTRVISSNNSSKLAGIKYDPNNAPGRLNVPPFEQI